MKAANLGIIWFTLAAGLTGPLAAQSRVLLPARPALQQLGLTPQQRRQLIDLRRGRRFELARMTRDIRERRGELAGLYRAYPLDEARANNLIQQIVQLETGRMRLQLQNQVELRRILTREQFIRFTQLTEAGPRSAASARTRFAGTSPAPDRTAIPLPRGSEPAP